MGLLRTVGRTAAVTSTATRVHGRAARRQQGRWAQQDAQAQTRLPAQPVGVDLSSQLAQLTQLSELKAAGVLSDAEFEAKKALILGR